MKKATMIKLLGMITIIIILSLSIGDALVQGKNPDLASFILVHFSGYLFFLLMPVEILFIYYLSEGHNALLLIVLALSTAIAAQLIDYFLGVLSSKKLIDEYVGRKRYEKFDKRLHSKYQHLIIFFFNVSFLSSPIVAFIAGIMRIKMKRFLKQIKVALIWRKCIAAGALIEQRSSIRT